METNIYYILAKDETLWYLYLTEDPSGMEVPNKPTKEMLDVLSGIKLQKEDDNIHVVKSGQVSGVRKYLENRGVTERSW